MKLCTTRRPASTPAEPKGKSAAGPAAPNVHSYNIPDYSIDRRDSRARTARFVEINYVR